MAEFTLKATVEGAYEPTVERVRTLLADAGFGILTEIDLATTLRTKLGVEIAPQVILGACRPQLAYRVLEADPRLAAMLPCNVVVASEGEARTRVEVFDPAAMTSFSDAPELEEFVDEARDRLTGMLTALGEDRKGATSAT